VSLIFECFIEYCFGFGVGVDVGGVEGCDVVVECCVYVLGGDVVFDL